MRDAGRNGALAVGFVAVAIAIVVARSSPATGYEVSIYAGTPTATWIAFGVALAIAAVGAITFRGIHQAVSLALGGLAVTSIVCVPLVRGYRFYGMGDALTHLGWVRDFVSGETLPHDILYPGLHSIASFIHLLGGVSTEHALWIGVVALFVPFVIFVPLAVRDVTGSATAVGLAGIAAWFVLPVNNIATHMGAHTNSNALFFVPVVIFALVAYLRRDAGPDGLPLGLSPYTALLVLSGIALLLVHPQHMINVVALLAAFSAVQYLVRGRGDDHPISRHPSTFAPTVLLGGAALLWALSNERFRSQASGLVYGLLSGAIGGGNTVTQRSASLTEVGGSLGEIFVKMFLVSALIGLVSVLFVLLVWLGRTAADRETRAFVTYFTAALIPLGGMFVVYFLGTPTMAFRQLGFIFVVLTILGAMALGYGLDWLREPLTTSGANTVVAVGLGACLVLSLMTVFASPVIYNPSQPVSDQMYSGYETSLDNRGEQPFAGLGYPAYRYDDAINGVEEIGSDEDIVGAGRGTVDPEAFNDGDYSGAYPSDEHFLVVSEYDTEREFGVYRELNHEREALDDMETHEGVNKVVSNEEFRLYEVTADA